MGSRRAAQNEEAHRRLVWQCVLELAQRAVPFGEQLLV
jgi:hypothetical protein